MALAQQLEQLIHLGIFLLGATLAALSYVAWRRERTRRMLVVTVAYLLFATFGLIVFLETVLFPLVPSPTLELLEHASAVLVLFGLAAFFAAMTQE